MERRREGERERGREGVKKKSREEGRKTKWRRKGIEEKKERRMEGGKRVRIRLWSYRLHCLILAAGSLH